MNPIRPSSSSNLKRILEPVDIARTAGFPLAPDVMGAMLDELAEAVTQRSSDDSIRQLADQAREALVGGNEDACFERLSDLATQVAFGMMANTPGVSRGLDALALKPPNILQQINVRFHDVGDERRVTVNMPPGMSFAEIYEAINKVPGRRQDGIWLKSNLKAAPQDDKVPVGEQTFTIYFGIKNKNRDEQAAYLADKGQGFADPWVVTMAEAAQLAEHGLEQSLFSYQGRENYIRTKKSVNTKGVLVWSINSFAYGVSDLHSNDFVHEDTLVAAGFSNTF